MSAWDDVRDLIDGCDADGVAALVVTLDDAARREVAKQLPGHLKDIRLYLDSWRGAGERAEALRAAGAGTIAAAASVASWLTRRGLVGADEQVDDTRRLLDLVGTRPPAWQAELATRLAGKLRGRDPSYELTASLIHRTGIEPPTDDGFVVGWVSAVIGHQRVADVLAADPLLDTLLPRIFHAQGVGAALQWEGHTSGSTWLGGLHTLAAGGRVDRAMLLDGCVGRFLRGGTALELRFFVRLHQALEPTHAEVAPRARDYLRLLPSAPGTVAELALGHLRELPAVSPGDFAEAVEALMYRPEKKLVRAGLSWLDRSVRLTPEYAEAATATLAAAFAHESSDVQERAVRLAVEHAAHLDRAPLRDASAALPADLRARLGVSENPGEEDDKPPLLIAPELPRVEFPPPITTAAELGAEFTRLARDPFDQFGWRGIERLMAGLVELTHRDREAVRAALASVPVRTWERGENGDPLTWLWAAMQAVASPSTASPAPRVPDQGWISVPHLLILRRMAELVTAARAGALPPVLLATPTSVGGHVDPAELLARLERLEAVDMDPPNADLQQALLRLPRRIDAEVAARAARLTTPAGRLVARWLSGEGLADPVVTVRYGYSEGASHRWFDDGQPPPYHYNPRAASFVAASPVELDLVDLVDLLCRDPRTYVHGLGGCMGWWAGVMPSHREVVAAHLLPFFSWDWPDNSPRLPILHDLARADGPLGSAFAAMLAFHLNNEDPAERTAALDLLLALAAAGDLPSVDLGDQLGHLVKNGMVTLSRVIPSLTEAERAGAGAQVWQTVAAALPRVLPADGERPPSGLADLIALGVRTAPSGDTTRIPGLAAVAARGGSSRMVREAVRLTRLLPA
ncbi:DUF6493 family protein [Streptosporangium sp. NBC_01495]|uniref:DUF6493 family protein n=1 Tax=Streptosporangium sp. NBC_01495 TaxID=2903899 RepID=UPI002E310578|nr:DUF6493 family protein [Streptosporangium sp. NBC_01495]